MMLSRGKSLNICWYVLRGNVLPSAPVSTLSLIMPCTLGESCITSRVLKASLCTIECTSVLDISMVSNTSTSDILSADKCISWFECPYTLIVDGSVDNIFCCLLDLWNDSFWLVSVGLEVATFGTCYSNGLDYHILHIHSSMQDISLACVSFHNFHKIMYVFLLCVWQHQLLYHYWRLTLKLMMSVMQ